MGTPCPVLRHAAPVLPWVAVRVHDVTGCDLGIAPVPWPVELGDEITVDGHPWPVEIVDLVWGGAGRGACEGARGCAARCVMRSTWPRGIRAPVRGSGRGAGRVV